MAAVLLAPSPGGALWLGHRAESRWRGTAIAVDGSAEDWKSPEGDEAEGLMFVFANDDKDLYVLVSPHTKSTKAQLSGENDQDFTLWLDPKAGKKKNLAIRLLAPARGQIGPDRELVAVGLDSATASDQQTPAGAEVRVGPADERGVLEARIPLRYLGARRPQRVTVGFETSAPVRPHGRKEAGSGKDRSRGGDRSTGSSDTEESDVLRLWVRVTLAEPPPLKKP